MKKFDELYNKIISEAKSPKFQFKKGDEVFVNIGKETIPGKIIKASHDKELGNKYDVDIDYNYYCDYCNGRHYTVFVPPLVDNDKDKINLLDVLAIVKYMKTNHQGPWAV